MHIMMHIFCQHSFRSALFDQTISRQMKSIFVKKQFTLRFFTVVSRPLWIGYSLTNTIRLVLEGDRAFSLIEKSNLKRISTEIIWALTASRLPRGFGIVSLLLFRCGSQFVIICLVCSKPPKKSHFGQK